MVRSQQATGKFSRRSIVGSAVAAAVVALGAVSCGGSAAIPVIPAATVEPFTGQGEIPLLVDASWLREQQTTNKQLHILDLSKLDRYREQHIPNAIHAWWQNTVELNDPIYGTVLQPTDFTDQSRRIRLLETLGIDDSTWVIAYDDDRGRWAARLVWFLRLLGHDLASVLDGGLSGWQSIDGTIDTASHDASKRAAPTIAPRQGYYIGDDDFLEWRNDSRTLIVDVRTDDEARDDVNNSLPLGRIPNAFSFPWTDTLRDEAGRLKSSHEIAALLAQAGISIDRRVVLYARFGVETAQPWLVLKLMGFPECVIYDRGWAGWASDPSNEIVPLEV